MLGFLSAYFWANPSVVGWSLAIVFGVIWLACYRPPFISRPWLWAVMAGGAIAAPLAIVITSFPLSFGVSRLLNSLMSQQTVQNWGWLLSIPSIFIFGLIWEGAKLVPVTIYWWRKKRDIDPKFGLLMGAVAGAGFGIMLAQWTNNFFISDNKLSWALVQAQGFTAISGFWESFFVLGLNVAATALAGWGLAKGWGWKFYLLAASVYLVTNYNTVLVNYEYVTATQAQLIIAAWALIVVGVTLWLRERELKPLPKKSMTRPRKSGISQKK
jgi:RsiW-degrading membrane proteinase PrsW (M82 family)